MEEQNFSIVRGSQYYMGNPNLKAANVGLEFTEEQKEEYIKCMQDPIYFIENYVYIVTLDEGPKLFKMYDFQKKKIDIMNKNRLFITMEGRQNGKCCCKGTKYKIRNKKTGEIKYLAAEEFHDIVSDKN